MTRLLFVCMGNICRSPAAENVMRHLAESEGLSDRLEIDSAGTIGLHTGHPPDERMTEAARQRGIPMKRQARQITVEDLDAFDHILVMDRDNLDDVEMLAVDANGHKATISMFCDYCTGYTDIEVPDPYYGGPDGFEKVLDLIEDGCREIARRVRDGEM